MNRDRIIDAVPGTARAESGPTHSATPHRQLARSGFTPPRRGPPINRDRPARWIRTPSHLSPINGTHSRLGGLCRVHPEYHLGATIPASLTSPLVTFSQHSLYLPRIPGKASCSRNLVSFPSPWQPLPVPWHSLTTAPSPPFPTRVRCRWCSRWTARKARIRRRASTRHHRSTRSPTTT